MPKVRLSPEEQQDREEWRDLMVQVGRAVSLSAVAARASERLEDHAIAAADNAWRKVADRFIAFAERD